jgi:mono/diheme cytochrome c family protein
VCADVTDGDVDRVVRGRYLSMAADCMACHTVKGRAPYAGGKPIRIPMGYAIPGNITPSRVAGIGRYSEQDFAAAVREGRRPDGTHLVPAMPYSDYAGMTDADVGALYAYFMTDVAAVDTVRDERTSLRFPFNLPGVLSIWNRLFLASGRFTPDPAASDRINRGRYLVDVLAHCGTCHSGRNALLATDKRQYLGGGFVDGWYAPNITSDEISGLGGWSENEVARFLQTGHIAGKGQAAGGMAEAIASSYRYLAREDIASIVSYLRVVPAIRDPKQVQPAYAFGVSASVLATDFEHGEAAEVSPNLRSARPQNGAVLYSAACAACHGIQGSGKEDQPFLSLTHNTAVGSVFPNNIVMAITAGIHRDGADGEVSMPAFSASPGPHNDALTDAQIAAVTNYVTAQFGKGGAPLTAAAVHEIRAGGRPPFFIRNAGTVFVAAILLALLIGLGMLRRKR